MAEVQKYNVKKNDGLGDSIGMETSSGTRSFITGQEVSPAPILRGPTEKNSEGGGRCGSDGSW
jgi:hypothetical protein